MGEHDFGGGLLHVGADGGDVGEEGVGEVGLVLEFNLGLTDAGVLASD
jgi:hypothetical protein